MKPPYENTEGVIAQLSQEEGERNVATAICVQLAGRAIIRVVSRCEEAQDNCNLGNSNLFFFYCNLNLNFWREKEKFWFL